MRNAIEHALRRYRGNPRQGNYNKLADAVNKALNAWRAKLVEDRNEGAIDVAEEILGQ